MSEGGGAHPGRRRSVVEYGIFALLAFVPMLATQPGTVSDDTKTYLYLDPGRYVRQAVSMWNPNVALGTVTHENIGYLLPMGPFYWAMAELHVPIWVAQRIWLGSILFAAGAGTLYLCRTIGLGGPGRYVASFGFMFTPYVLQYAGRISVILMAWAGLPWMIAFVVLALRRGGWRYPALFALVVALVSGINASSILYVGVGPALYLLYSVLVLRESTWREAWGVAWKVGLLTAFVSLWWAVALEVEAAYGVNILKYTETVNATSSSTSPSEIVRGLGYWFFYGASDQVGNWTQAAVAYTQHLWLMGLSFLVPVLGVLGAVIVKWRHRAYFVLLIVVGMVLAVGPYPYNNPTAVSAVIKAFMLDTTAGLALRSTDRASPLVLLGLAVLLGAGITALWRRASRTALAVGAGACAAIVGASAPMWTGATVVNNLSQPASPPTYVQQAAAHLNATHPGTRVYALPGNNFAAYRWGDTIDTVYPALLDRPFVTHEQQTMGSLPTADLLQAVDTPLQEGTLDPTTIAPMASLMSAGDVLVQYDQRFEFYDTPNPLQLAKVFAVTPPGLSDPVAFGSPRPNVSPVAHLDERTLSSGPDPTPTAPLVTYTVDHPRPIVRSESLHSPLVVAGNASGLVNASSVGLLSSAPTIFYAGTLDTRPALKRRVLAAHPTLVVTDTNRKQGFRWNGITQNAGYTETASEGHDTGDPTDSPLDIFPGAPRDAQSTTVFNGIASVTASEYGSQVKYFVDRRPAAALDGSTSTAWTVDGYPFGQWWQVTFTHPRTTDRINLVQLLDPHPGQVITNITLLFDDSTEVKATLGPASRTPVGQTITFAPRSFTTLHIVINSVKRNPKFFSPAGEQNPVGFSEVRIPGVTADEVVAMPTDLLRAAGASSIADPLNVLVDRQRSSGYPPRSDPEPALARSFWLPTARTFSLAGQARLSPLASDATLAATLGATGAVPSSSSRLTGSVSTGALAALDPGKGTVWEPGFGSTDQVGSWLEYALAAPLTFDRLTLDVVADGLHSVPTAITVSAGGASEKLALPAVARSRVAGSTVTVPLSLPTPLTGQTVRITVDAVDLAQTTDFHTVLPVALPIGIAHVGITGLDPPVVPVDVPSTCRADLLAVDGTPVWVSVSGSSAAALVRDPLAVTLCGPDAGGLSLGPGTHLLRATAGQSTGLDVDQLAFSSAAGGGAAPIAAGGQLAGPPATGTPPVHVVSQSPTSMQLSVTGITTSTAPFELVMGQSVNAGWTATAGGTSLGAPELLDGFANGWTVTPAALAGALDHGQLTVSLRFAPQRSVNIALILSALALVACIVLAIRARPPQEARNPGRRGPRTRGGGSRAHDRRSFDERGPASPRRVRRRSHRGARRRADRIVPHRPPRRRRDRARRALPEAPPRPRHPRGGLHRRRRGLRDDPPGGPAGEAQRRVADRVRDGRWAGLGGRHVPRRRRGRRSDHPVAPAADRYGRCRPRRGLTVNASTHQDAFSQSRLGRIPHATCRESSALTTGRSAAWVTPTTLPSAVTTRTRRSAPPAPSATIEATTSGRRTSAFGTSPPESRAATRASSSRPDASIAAVRTSQMPAWKPQRFTDAGRSPERDAGSSPSWTSNRSSSTRVTFRRSVRAAR